MVSKNAWDLGWLRPPPWFFWAHIAWDAGWKRAQPAHLEVSMGAGVVISYLSLGNLAELLHLHSPPSYRNLKQPGKAHTA